MASNVPATAFSTNGGNSASQLVVGSTFLSTNSYTAGYWYVVVDLSNDLSVVANEFSTDNSNPPANVAAMLGNPNYFLFFIAQNVITGNLPQGALASFLNEAGSGAQLAALEQSIGQLGTGYFVTFSYVLAATLNNQDLPGFEESSLYNPSVLTMAFMPLTVDGRTVWAPIQLGTTVSATMVRAVQSPPLAAPM